jgi:hypothetical protein
VRAPVHAGGLWGRIEKGAGGNIRKLPAFEMAPIRPGYGSLDRSRKSPQ